METLDRNKYAVMAALAVAGITSVVVAFDGGGDDGQIESIEARAGETTVELPATFVQMVESDDKEPVKSADETLLSDAIETLCYACLEQAHGGWEDNDGAFGTFTFTVADGTVDLDFNQRFIDSENYQHGY